MKFAFFTLGCKVNLFETQALAQLAASRGHEIVSSDADAVIINTCTVTSVSDHKNIRAFHKMRRENPNAVIAACGCFAQIDPERVRATGEIDLVCGTQDRPQVIERCEVAVQGKGAAEWGETARAFLPAGIPKGRTRALLKIEDGCDNYCAYCIIPYARGHIRSTPPVLIEQEVVRLENEGVREIILTGIEIASYGRDLRPRISLTDLLCKLLAAHPEVRFRLGSLDPRIADRDFCDRLAGFGNLARHFHLSLQSGCDAVLERMGRKYTTAQYYKSVAGLRNSFPDCSVTTDLIVGFPGETEEEFAQTLEFLNQCAFAAVHVFPYSVREGTRAAQMEGHLPQNVKTTRAARAKAAAARLSEAYLRRFLGRTLLALPEHPAKGVWVSHGTFGFPIYIEGTGIQKNVPLSVQAVDLYRDGLRAKII